MEKLQTLRFLGQFMAEKKEVDWYYSFSVPPVHHILLLFGVWFTHRKQQRAKHSVFAGHRSAAPAAQTMKIKISKLSILIEIFPN